MWCDRNVSVENFSLVKNVIWRFSMGNYDSCTTLLAWIFYIASNLNFLYIIFFLKNLLFHSSTCFETSCDTKIADYFHLNFGVWIFAIELDTDKNKKYKFSCHSFKKINKFIQRFIITPDGLQAVIGSNNHPLPRSGRFEQSNTLLLLESRANLAGWSVILRGVRVVLFIKIFSLKWANWWSWSVFSK